MLPNPYCSTTAQHSLHPDYTPGPCDPLNSEIREEAAAAAVMTVDDDRDGDDVTITTFGYETFELQLQQQFYPGV
jgi:hypothetical protein